MSESTPRIGALEAGGTKMVMAVATPDGTILEDTAIPTTAPADCVPQMIEWFAARDIDALGVAAFGPTGVDPKKDNFGYILKTPKLEWAGYDFLGTLRRGLNMIPAGYDTDVNGSCLGEATFGCARGLDTVLYLTIGTGIGAGVMVNGQLLHGMLHPEAGHIMLHKRDNDPGECVCPFHEGCFEGLAAGPSIEKRWGAKGVELAERMEVWELESDYIAEALTDYIMSFSPQKIILGGGVMKQEQMFPLVRKKVLANIAGYLDTPELADIDNYIVPNSLNEMQGILGCVELGRRALVAAQA